MPEVYDQALKVAAVALAVEVFEDVPPADALSEGILSDATAIVKALAAAGLLLPEGAVQRAEVAILWTGGGRVRHENWGTDSLERARKVAKFPPEWAVAGQIVQRQHYTTLWAAVEPVAIQGADSV